MSNVYISGSGGCFKQGTLISTPSGLVDIIDIKVGDEVTCYDDNGTIHTSKVISVNSHSNKRINKYVLWGGGNLYVTPNHWVLNNENTFSEIERINESLSLVDIRGFLVPIISSYYDSIDTVYNFIVDKYHTYIANGIRVHNGGGGKGSYTPVDSPDSLKSYSYIKILDLLCEGEIEGLATGDDRSIYINNVPLKNEDGSANFEDYKYSFRNGTEIQDQIDGFNSIESEELIGVIVKKSNASGVSSSYIDSKIVDRLRVTIGIPSLVTYSSNGDVVGGTVQYKIFLLTNNGANSLEIVNRTIEGKNTSKYQVNHYVNIRTIAPTATNYAIKVVRISDDSTSEKVQNSLYFDSITKIADTKLRYPNSALVGAVVQSAQFSSVPSRGYHLKMLKVKVPSNYNTITREYTSFWDGTFKSTIEYTNNPAWCFYDLVTNPRYGLGEFITENLVDKWTLYTIGKYCDELVSDGFGGYEPRFTLNTYLQTREDAIKVLTDLAGVFRGIVYAGDGTITASQDAPQSTADLIFTNSNVIEGMFTYSGASRKAIHTAALVTWNDPAALFKQKVEYVEDITAINIYGYNPTEVIAFGCTSRGQAHRVGKWLLYTERVESNIVTFAAGMDASYCRPGQIIKISDYNLLNNTMNATTPNTATIIDSGLAGRVIDTIDTTTVILDRIIATEVVGQPIVFTISAEEYPENQPLLSKAVYTTSVHTIASQSGSTLTLSTPIDLARIVPGTVFAIQYSSDLSESLYRIIYVKETTNEGIFDIAAMMHNPDKYNFIENDIALVNKSYTTLTAAPSTIDSSSIIYNTHFYINKDKQLVNSIEVGFTPAKNASSYRVEYKKDGSSWTTIYERLQYASFSMDNLSDNSYYSIKITPIGSSGIETNSSYIHDIYIAGKTTPPQDVPWITLVGNTLNIGPVSDIDLAGYIIKTSNNTETASWDSAVLESTDISTSTTYTLNNYTKGTAVFVKAIDTSGNLSLNAITATSSTYNNEPSNVVQTYNEHPVWLGAKENLVPQSNSLVAMPSSTNPTMWPDLVFKPTPSTTLGQTVYDTTKGASCYIAVTPQGAGQVQIYKSTNGIYWEGVAGTGYGDVLRSVSSNDGSTFVAVGSSMIKYSTDNGNTWQSAIGSYTNKYFKKVVFASGLFILVGIDQSTNNNIIFSSVDGINWTQRVSTGNGGLNSVYYANNTFVAVGSYTGTQSNILYSTNGTSWSTVVGIANMGDIYSISYITKTNLWIVGTLGGNISTSSDILTWNTVFSGISQALNYITYIEDRDIIIICGNNNTLLVSKDGIIFHSATTNNTDLIDDYYTVFYSSEEDLFCLPGSASVYLGISKDGYNFYNGSNTQYTFPDISSNFYDLPAYKATSYTTKEYEFTDYTSTTSPTKIFLDYDILGDNLSLEYGVIGNNILWTNESDNMWYTVSSGYSYSMWEQSINFIPYTTKGILVSPSNSYFVFRVSSESSTTTQLTLNSLSIIVDMPDIVVNLKEYPLTGINRVVDVIGKFKNITHIQGTVYNSSVPLSINIVDKNAQYGPLLQCKDYNGNIITAKVDLVIKGY
jgi:predicted phage tail protein